MGTSAGKPRVLNIVQAVNEALDLALATDERVVIFGEDVGQFGGVFRTTLGLVEKYGENRVADTPLSEGGIVGAAVGMALYGLRPVPEIQFADFIFPGYDQIVNELAYYRYRSGGEYPCPVTIRTPYGGGIGGGHYHSQSPETLFLHRPGLKVVIPSTPHDAKGLLLAAIRDDDPVIFMEPKRVYRGPAYGTNWSAHPGGVVPEGDYEVELGKAAITRSGDDCTLLAYGAMMHVVEPAADKLREEGIEVEVLDLRTLLPLDIETITKSVERTGRAVIVHEAPRTCGFGGELAALLMERCFYSLEAPIQRVTGFDTPFPYALDKAYLPDETRVMAAVKATLEA